MFFTSLWLMLPGRYRSRLVLNWLLPTPKNFAVRPFGSEVVFFTSLWLMLPSRHRRRNFVVRVRDFRTGRLSLGAGKIFLSSRRSSQTRSSCLRGQDLIYPSARGGLGFKIGLQKRTHFAPSGPRPNPKKSEFRPFGEITTFSPPLGLPCPADVGQSWF